MHKARTPLAVGPSAEGGGANAVRVGVARGVGVARAGAEVGAPAKRRTVGPKVAQATGSSTLSLADLVRMAARSGGLTRPPPPPVTQGRFGKGGGCEESDDPLFLEFLRACTPRLGWLSAELRCTP